MSWSDTLRSAIEAAAVQVITDPTSSEWDIAAARRAMTLRANWSKLSDAELALAERLQARLHGESDTPVVADTRPAPIVAHAARCTRCEGLRDEDLAELRAVLAEDQEVDQVDQVGDDVRDPTDAAVP